MITLINPKNGADIESVYCERGKEIYKEEVERENGLEVKVRRVTNAEPFVLKVGEKITVPEHQAEWALHTWGFLMVDGTVQSSSPKMENDKDDKAEEMGQEKSADQQEMEQDPSDRFADLQIKGFRNLKGAERDEYIKLKGMLKQ